MSHPPDKAPDPHRDPRQKREDMTRLIREEAQRRRSADEASHADERKTRIPFRALAILTLATITVIAATRSVSEVIVFLKHPGETPVREVTFAEVDRIVPSVSVKLDGKILVIDAGASWDMLDREERSRRFASLCGVLANRFYHGARMIGPGGRVVAHWADGLIQVE